MEAFHKHVAQCVSINNIAPRSTCLKIATERRREDRLNPNSVATHLRPSCFRVCIFPCRMRLYAAHPIGSGDSARRTFLEQSQQPEGFWGTGTETRGLEIYSMVPGSHDAFRVGTTSLCIMALRQAGEKTAHDKAVEWLLAHGDARRDDGSIALQHLGPHLRNPRAGAGDAIATKIRASRRRRNGTSIRWLTYATYAGGWNYYDFDAHTQLDSMGATSFGTAAGLVALYEARKSGLDVPQRMIDLAVHRLEEARLPNGVFLYGSDYKYMPAASREHAARGGGADATLQSCAVALEYQQK